MSPDLSLGAVVLAGGRSSRMGQDKALLAVDGVPLLLRVCLAAQQCTDQIYVVTPWPERYRELLSQVPVFFLTETEIPQGPLRGFADALTQLQQPTQAQPRPDWLLLLACDLPNLRPVVLQNWGTLLRDVPPTTLALLPQNPAGWWEPLCGFYRPAAEATIAAYIAQGGSSFQGWLQQIAVQALPYDPTLLFNCNRPEDLQQAHRQQGHRQDEAENT
jgi:molybdenum cofactor guanylyltransferase